MLRTASTMSRYTWGVGGPADHMIGGLVQNQLPHVADAQAVFDQGEDQVVVPAGVLHPGG